MLLQQIVPSHLDTFFDLSRQLRESTRNYHALVDAAEAEITEIERDFSAELLSRTGFVFQEIKDLEYQVINEVTERSLNVSSQECIIEATSRLAAASLVAGTNSMPTYQQVYSLLLVTHILYVHPTLSELTLQFFEYNFEPLAMLGEGNPVSNIGDILDTLSHEVHTYHELFEQFVDQIIHDMENLSAFYAELRRDLNDSLEETRTQFISSVNEIRSLLVVDCE